MLRKRFIGLAGGIALIAIAALNWTAIIHAADGKGDRFPIDLNEVQAEAEKRFADADANDDGSLSAEEFANLDMRGPFAQRRGQRGDRTPGKRDQRARRDRSEQFEAADENGDGQLSAQEYEDMPKAVRAARLERLFARLDANADGKLTADELPSQSERLARLDANGDGKISRDEMPRRRPRP